MTRISKRDRMGFPKSQHFNGNAVAKIAYETASEANKTIVEIDQLDLVAYRCGFCGKFHIGRNKKKKEC